MSWYIRKREYPWSDVFSNSNLTADYPGKWWPGGAGAYHEVVHLREAVVDHLQGSESAVRVPQQQTCHCGSWSVSDIWAAHWECAPLAVMLYSC